MKIAAALPDSFSSYAALPFGQEGLCAEIEVGGNVVSLIQLTHPLPDAIGDLSATAGKNRWSPATSWVRSMTLLDASTCPGRASVARRKSEDLLR